MTLADLKKIVDINKDGTVDVKDVLKLVKNNARDALYVGAGIGFLVGGSVMALIFVVF